MQLELLWRDDDTLKRELEAQTGLRLELIVTDNRSTMMSMRRGGSSGSVQLRVHRMFLSANASVVTALSRWVSRQRCDRSGRLLDAFIREHQHLLRRSFAINRLRTRGEYVDLLTLYDEVNRDHFEDGVDAHITWGRRPAPRRRRSIRFGSYTPADNIIRMHPYLDQEFVPVFFVRYIVFHEMLHAHLGIAERPSGRRSIHTPEFNALERNYPDYERACAWQDNPKNLRRLLS